MNEAFQPGDRVMIVSGAFATMPGVVISPTEAAIRWPNTPTNLEVDRGEALWVILRIFGHDVPVIQHSTQLSVC